MISAKEARKQSEQNKQNILNKETAIIEEEINKAIAKGQDYTYIGSAISSRAKKFWNNLVIRSNMVSSITRVIRVLNGRGGGEILCAMNLRNLKIS